MTKRKRSFFHSATLPTNEKRKMLFFIYSLQSLCHDQEWKFFFHWATTITTLWCSEKKLFFSFTYYDHHAMIKRENFFFHSATLPTNEKRKMLFFIYSLQSLCHDQEWEFFFHLATAITTLWSREKKVFFSFTYYDHEAMIKGEKRFFLFATKFTNEEIKMSSFI